MKSLHLGDVAKTSRFIEAPSGRAIADGYQLLPNWARWTTPTSSPPIGAELARLPLDPRVGRMILEARERSALDEVLVIASALSVQDVRDRPMEAQGAGRPGARQVRRREERVHRLPQAVEVDQRARGGAPEPAIGACAEKAMNRSSQSASSQAMALPVGSGPQQRQVAPTHKLSNRQYEQLLRQNFINMRRVREWRDIHTQLHTVVAEHKWRINTSRPATSSCTCRCWPACWATSAASSTTKTGTWARAASSSTATPARTWPRSRALDRGRRAGGDHPPVWPRHRRIEPQWMEQVAATCSRSSCSTRTGRRRRPR
jgi:HrpA-like RNA helicase